MNLQALRVDTRLSLSGTRLSLSEVLLCSSPSACSRQASLWAAAPWSRSQLPPQVTGHKSAVAAPAAGTSPAGLPRMGTMGAPLAPLMLLLLLLLAAAAWPAHAVGTPPCLSICHMLASTKPMP